ncbi:diguanylate cyclase/phosphodiesterase (GGDEF & EAL domains) with PAS/PAC sensor(s) [hydrothermal vent metagenome]|uniref:Diguanylate cyclase/phosphodiesterase (GGDEF & EAL domains) with PAS/PAC sensor(S) n=1 Tax=hydrothermal vent metagenome TaxID=652676 RepID=A0A1W1EK12_9ZZZZ
MLLSTLLERERRFKIALRAGIPALIFIFVILYILFVQDTDIEVSIKDSLIVAGIVFTTIYFIYFMLELATKGTLLDKETDGFNQNAFIEIVKHKKPKTIALLVIKNLESIGENYGYENLNIALNDIIDSLDIFLTQYGVKNIIIGRYSRSKFILALDKDTKDIEDILNKFTQNYNSINNIDIDYIFSVIANNHKDSIRKIINLIDIDVINKQKKKIIVKDSKKEIELEEAIRDALKRQSLSFTFRPLLNSNTHKVDIYTISIKMILRDQRELLPRVYLPIINHLGLGQIYDLVVLKEVVKTASLIDESISLSFNLSPFSIRDRGFLKNALDIIKADNIEPSRIIIEIYEKNTHYNISNYLKILDNIRTKGIRISIDNFGSSNSSFDYIKYFKFDMVQFDRDFTRNINDKNSLAMFKSLLKMCNELNIITIAKWVDDDTQKEKLKELNIDYMQGFGIKKPISRRELIIEHN